jgi:hypothetical protein
MGTFTQVVALQEREREREREKTFGYAEKQTGSYTCMHGTKE